MLWLEKLDALSAVQQCLFGTKIQQVLQADNKLEDMISIIFEEILKTFNSENSLSIQTIVGRCTQRIQRQEVDILYLFKKGISFPTIATVICKEDDQESWKALFADELEILRLQSRKTVVYEHPSVAYKQWLKEHTTYSKIVQNRVKTPAGDWAFDTGLGVFSLKKSTLQAIFRKSVLLLRDRDKFGKITPPPNQSGIDGSFIVYRKNYRVLNILYWSGRQGNLDGCSAKLGEGAYSIVQKVVDMEEQKFLAMKSVSNKSRVTIEEGNKLLLGEYRTLESIHSGVDAVKSIIEKPEAIVNDGSFFALVGKCYMGSMARFVSTPSLWQETTAADLLFALLNALKGLQVLESKSLLHRDITPGNLLFEFKNKKLIAVLSDLEGAISCSIVVKKKIFVGYGSIYSCNDDLNLLQTLLCAGHKKEAQKVLYKREIYAFGKTLLEILISRQIPESPPDMEQLRDAFINVYGEPIYDILNRMLNPCASLRPAASDVIKLLEAELSQQSPRKSLLEVKLIENVFFLAE